jgi:hypothetical protein
VNITALPEIVFSCYPATLKRPDIEATKSQNDEPIEGEAMSTILTSSRMGEQTIVVKTPTTHTLREIVSQF